MPSRTHSFWCSLWSHTPAAPSRPPLSGPVVAVVGHSSPLRLWLCHTFRTPQTFRGRERSKRGYASPAPYLMMCAGGRGTSFFSFF